VDSVFAGSPFAPDAAFAIVTPRVEQFSLLPDGRQLLRFSGLAGETYQLETSVNLTDWNPGPLLGPLTTGVFETVQPAAAVTHRYFRLRLFN
jgi:hypothetical protein